MHDIEPGYALLDRFKKIPEQRKRLGKTDGACFIKKSAREKTTSGFMNVLHERSEKNAGRP